MSHLTTNVPRFAGAVKVSSPTPSKDPTTKENRGVDSNWDCRRGGAEAAGAAEVEEFAALAMLTALRNRGDAVREGRFEALARAERNQSKAAGSGRRRNIEIRKLGE